MLKRKFTKRKFKKVVSNASDYVRTPSQLKKLYREYKTSFKLKKVEYKKIKLDAKNNANDIVRLNQKGINNKLLAAERVSISERINANWIGRKLNTRRQRIKLLEQRNADIINKQFKLS